jgi:drug/metabolite transporter (DMT)-like permease
MTWAVPTNAIALLFVLLWSSGFIASKAVLRGAEPMTVLALRFAVAAVVLALVTVAARAPWPRGWRLRAHVAIAGLLLHGVYLAGVYEAIARGTPAWMTALIAGLQPVLTALAAAPMLRERVPRRAWCGLLLGLAAVAVAALDRAAPGQTVAASGIAFAALGLAGVTAGTLYQKRFCGPVDVRAAATLQYAATCVVFAVLAPACETMQVRWTPVFVVALAWLVVGLSFLAIALLFVLIRRGTAAATASVFYLVPPCTSVFAVIAFGERLGPAAWVGIAGSAIAVVLVRGAAPAPPVDA